MPFIAQQLRAAQITRFSARQQQAVRLLQMPTHHYLQTLRRTSQDNPFLIIEEPEPAPDGPEFEAAHSDRTADDDHHLWPGYRDSRCAAPVAADAWLAQLPQPVSLKAHLHQQLGSMRLSIRGCMLARLVVESLDSDGYLRVDLGEIAALLEEPLQRALPDFQAALAHVQALDPCGVGARTLAECLTLQPDAWSDDMPRAIAKRIIEHHLDLLAAGDFRKLAHAVGANAAQVQAAVEAIKRLNPRPGSLFEDHALPTAFVASDVTVQKVRGKWRTFPSDGSNPAVQLDATCEAWLQSHQANGQDELKAHLNEARWAVHNAAQRSHTILAVAQAIADRQHRFFDYGALAMKPLGLQEIADTVGIHASTVSRTVHGKYMATPSGLVEFRQFFSRGLKHTTGGASAPVALQALIRELIAAERPARVLSDAALARELAQQGFKIARRTVTQYRQALKIEAVELRRMRAREQMQAQARHA